MFSKKQFISSLYSLFFCILVSAETKVDSLINLWSNDQLSAETRFGAIKSVAWDGFLKTNPDSSIYYSDLYFSFANSLQNPIEMAHALYIKGHACKYKGDYINALEYSLEALHLYDSVQYKKGIANTNNFIGNFYLEANNNSEGLKYFEQALLISKETNDLHGQAYSLNNIGNIHRVNGNLKLAIENYNKSLEIKKNEDDQKSLSSTYSNLGNVFWASKNYTNAIDYYQKSLNISQKFQDYRGIASAHVNIGSAYNKMKEYDSALLSCTKGMKIAKEINATEIVLVANEILYLIHKEQGDFEKSLSMYEQHHLLKDSLITINLDKNLEKLRLQKEFEYRKKENAIRYELELNVSENKLKSEKTYRWSLFILLGFILLSFIVIAERLSTANKHKTVIKNHKQILQKKNSALNKALIKEKQLGELKSGFVSTASHQFRTPLSAIQSNAELLEMFSSTIGKEHKEKFRKVTGRIKGEIYKMTELMDEILILGKLTTGNVNFKPQELNLVEFINKIGNEFNELQADGRIINIVTEGEPYNVHLDSKLLNHSLSNLISNAFKYSLGKHNPELKVSFKTKEFVLFVKDYGIGIPKDELSKLFQPFFRANNVAEIKGTGLGLSIAKEYIEINKGQIKANSIMGEGSCFEIKFNN